eukprot:2708974-Prymnesium_polylepis.2
MNHCIALLQTIGSIYTQAVDTSKNNTLTSTAASKGTLASPKGTGRRARPPVLAVVRARARARGGMRAGRACAL